MNKSELIKKLNDIEWEDFEVKEAHLEIPKNSWETVSVFSNTGGGWLIFGVSKKGKDFKMTGVKNPEKTEQDFTNTLRGEKFNVKIRPICRKYKFPEGMVLGFYIPISNKKPVYFNTLSNTFIRTASGDQRASKEEIDSMFRDQAFGTRSSGTVATSSTKSINEKSFKGYKEYLLRANPSHPYNKISQREFFQKLRVISNEKYTYSGLFFFGKEDAIQEIIPDFRVDYLEIPGTSYSDATARYSFRLDEQENLWEYYFAISERLRRHLDLPFQLNPEGFATENHPQLDALREALVNLLMHADYFSPARPRIRVFDDRIEFFNPGALPKPLKQIMAEDISLPRNPIIAKLFRVVKLAENAGYGFDKMINGWKKYTGKKPEFEQGQDFTKATFYLATKAKIAMSGIPETDQHGSEKVRRKFGDRFGESSEKILDLIFEDKFLSASAISEKIGISSRAVEKALSKLKEMGVIERVGSAKGGYWKIKIKPE